MIRQKKHGHQGEGLISVYIYVKNFKNLLVKNHWPDFIKTAEMFPWWASTKIVQVIMICQKTWPLGGGAGLIFHIYLYRKL